MSHMARLGIIFAKMLPEEMIIEELQEKLTQYKLTKSEESKQGLKMYAMLLATKFATEKEDLDKTISKLDQIQSIHERLNTDKQS